MAALRTELERIFDTTENSGHNSHQREAAVWELASHEAIVGRMASLLGPDLSIWRTNFFVKEGVDSDSPLQREIPFHQDANYWPLEPAVIIPLRLDRGHGQHPRDGLLASDPQVAPHSCPARASRP